MFIVLSIECNNSITDIYYLSNLSNLIFEIDVREIRWNNLILSMSIKTKNDFRFLLRYFQCIQ
jgi:hypothetical protein